MKMFTADYQEMVAGKTTGQKHAVSIKIDGVELIPNISFQEITWNFYRSYGKFTAYNPLNTGSANPAYMNFYRQVFRARNTSAELIISDWADEDKPGGAVGQELIYNFIEVQPYFVGQPRVDGLEICNPKLPLGAP